MKTRWEVDEDVLSALVEKYDLGTALVFYLLDNRLRSQGSPARVKLSEIKRIVGKRDVREKLVRLAKDGLVEGYLVDYGESLEVTRVSADILADVRELSGDICGEVKRDGSRMPRRDTVLEMLSEVFSYFPERSESKREEIKLVDECVSFCCEHNVGRQTLWAYLSERRDWDWRDAVSEYSLREKFVKDSPRE